MKRKTTVGIVVGAFVLAAVGGVVVWSLSSRAPSAEEAADTYLRALSDGDAEAVRSLLEIEPENFAQIESAFSSADAYLGDYTFEVFEDSSVRAEVDFDGEPAVVGFGLSEGADGFRVTSDYLATLEATTTLGDSVTIGSTIFSTSEAAHLLPALYTVGAAPAELFSGDAAVVVTNENPVRVAVEASLSAEGIALIASQLDDYARACAEPGATVPENCGLRVPWAADLAALSAITFRIDQLPVLAVADDLASFAATDGIIVATAIGTTRDGASASFTYRADDWALRGVIELTNGRMALRVI
ncbi:hypothetical protein LG299_04070 [Microbacterium lacus]|uniref:hypothetical protein n=1 Tax=Microbacterium lacus TaxID=415217 RepID=UPI00384F76C3